MPGRDRGGEAGVGLDRFGRKVDGDQALDPGTLSKDLRWTSMSSLFHEFVGDISLLNQPPYGLWTAVQNFYTYFISYYQHRICTVLVGMLDAYIPTSALLCPEKFNGI